MTASAIIFTRNFQWPSTAINLQNEPPRREEKELRRRDRFFGGKTRTGNWKDLRFRAGTEPSEILPNLLTIGLLDRDQLKVEYGYFIRQLGLIFEHHER